MTSTVPVVVILPPRVLLLDIAGPIEILRKANLEQDRLRFSVSFHGPTRAVMSSIGLRLSEVEPLPERLPDGAMVMIAGSVDAPLHAAREGQADPGAGTEGGAGVQSDAENAGDAVDEATIVRWLRRTVRADVDLVTICSGALLAGKAGLFDGHDCTTHHATTEALRAVAPAARVRDNRLYVEDRHRLSSAGVTAGIDLMLAIIARRLDVATALSIARYLVVYLRRAGGDPQLSPWLEGRNHLHPAIHRAQDAISAEPARAWSVQALADVATTSPRHLSRLFNDHVGMSVSDYVSRIRVTLARELVCDSRLGMERIAERAGFASTRQLRRAWARWQPVSPSHLRDARARDGRSGRA